MNTAGRITSSFLYDISYDLFSGKTIGISNFAMYAADVSLDAIIAPVGYYYTSNISNSYLSATINGLVDGIVDIFQTIALFCE